MSTKPMMFILVAVFPLLVGADYAPKHTPLWERMCAACHDGKTILNGSVVIDREQMKEKYKTIDALANAVACEGPACMNILKHDEKLVRRVGKEIGIKDARP